MSIKWNHNLKKLYKGFRIEVHCLNCDEIYITNLMPTLKMPRRCKYCSSTILKPIRYMEG